MGRGSGPRTHLPQIRGDNYTSVLLSSACHHPLQDPPGPLSTPGAGLCQSWPQELYWRHSTPWSLSGTGVPENSSVIPTVNFNSHCLLLSSCFTFFLWKTAILLSSVSSKTLCKPDAQQSRGRWRKHKGEGDSGPAFSSSPAGLSSLSR